MMTLISVTLLTMHSVAGTWIFLSLWNTFVNSFSCTLIPYFLLHSSGSTCHDFTWFYSWANLSPFKYIDWVCIHRDNSCFSESALKKTKATIPLMVPPSLVPTMTVDHSSKLGSWEISFQSCNIIIVQFAILKNSDCFLFLRFVVAITYNHKL